MFEASLQLRVTRKEFFDLLMESLIGEYEHFTNKKLDRADVKEGLTYNKPVQVKRKEIEGTVKVTRLVENKLYQSRIRSSAATNTIRYILEDIEDSDEIMVTFQQETMMAGNKQPKQGGFFANLIEKRTRKRTVALLRQMEDYILKNRED